jgi:hypothetical protein
LFLRPPRRWDAASGRGPPGPTTSSSDLIGSWFPQNRRSTRGLETAPGSCSSPSRARVPSDTFGAQTGHTVRPAMTCPPPNGSGRRATRSARERHPTLAPLVAGAREHGCCSGCRARISHAEKAWRTLNIWLVQAKFGGRGGIRTSDHGRMRPCWHGRGRSPPSDFPRRDAEKAGSRTGATEGEPRRKAGRWMLVVRAPQRI